MPYETTIRYGGSGGGRSHRRGLGWRVHLYMAAIAGIVAVHCLPVYVHKVQDVVHLAPDPVMSRMQSAIEHFPRCVQSIGREHEQ